MKPPSTARISCLTPIGSDLQEASWYAGCTFGSSVMNIFTIAAGQPDRQILTRIARDCQQIVRGLRRKQLTHFGSTLHIAQRTNKLDAVDQRSLVIDDGL